MELLDYRWHQIGRSLDEVAFWVEYCEISDRPKAEEWYKSGRTTQEAKAWAEAGFVWGSGCLKQDHIDQWQEAGFSPQEAQAWDRVFEPLFAKRVAEVIAWHSHGFLPHEAKTWKDAGFSVGASGLAAGYKKAQVPPQLAYYFARQKTPPEKTAESMRAIRSQCASGVKTQGELRRANPYDIKGYCYVFSGQQTLLASRNEAVYGSEVLVRFGRHSAPGQIAGIVKGTGTRKAQNVLGREVVIPTADFVASFAADE
jgi:hypothetical protein